ncbi:MAG: hypothetical protein N2559_12555 [Anaerolineae bacterium]|nr:hypothetical protein [Anaerolineae bacterium]
MHLQPCPYRRTDDDGHILCDKIKSGDREVNAATCRACPIAAINCAHLRATLEHHARPPLVVRWGNGKTEVWDDFAQESLTLTRAACAEKVMPITSVNDCAGCALRQALVDGRRRTEDEGRRTEDERRRTEDGRRKTEDEGRGSVSLRAARRAPTPVAAPPPTPQPDARSSMVAQKIIQLQEWLAKQSRAPQPRDESEEEVAPPSRRVAARVVGEEKRVGWTD